MAGLILLVIVGAWLAVLVPMALKSHDAAASLGSADRFSDAMRVLSRRSSRDVLVPRRSSESLVVSETKSPRPAPATPAAEEPVSMPRTASQRRLRTLLVLVGGAVFTLLLGLLRFRVLLVVHVGCDLLLVAFAMHLRRQAIFSAQFTAQRRARDVRPDHRRAVNVRPAGRIAGIPDRMPPRPAPLPSPLPIPAARCEDVPAAATGTDGTWSPVPVPLPTYVRQVVPRQESRTFDPTEPGQWTGALEGDGSGYDKADDGRELADIIERRRVVNGW